MYMLKKTDWRNPWSDGFITFIHVDKNSKPTLHFLEINPITDEDKTLYETAKNLRTK